MDILIDNLSRQVLESRVGEFVEILSGEPDEYWKEEHFRSELPEKFDLSVVAFSNNLVVGYIIASNKGGSAHIHKFMVQKNFRSKSVGLKMLSFFEKILYQRGYSSVELTVKEKNERAIRFYQSNSFTTVGKRTDSYDCSVLIIMSKNITGSFSGSQRSYPRN